MGTSFSSHSQPINLDSLRPGSENSWSNREILEAMLASAPIAIVMVDTQGSILYVNGKFEEMFGYTFVELVGEKIEMLIPERFRQDHVGHRRAYVDNPHVRSMGSGMDLAGRRKSGEEFPIEAGLSYVQVGEELVIMGSITDITRRKHTEEVLERRVEERTREIERRRKVSDGLRDILTVLNSNWSVEDILRHIVQQASELLYADAAAIYRTDAASGHMTIQAAIGLDLDEPSSATDTEPDRQQSAQQSTPTSPQNAPEDSKQDTIPDKPEDGASQAEQTPNERAPVPDRPGTDSKVGPWQLSPRTKQLVVSRVESGIDITHEQIVEQGDYVQFSQPYPYQALLTVPLMVKEETYGNLILYYREMRRFSSEEIELATMVGDQTALAIENARLRTQIERSAIAAERSRIARDLHDSVTQTLFSASLIAEVLPRLWRRNSDETERRLDELRQLTRGALAEMRTLLLELRPATLMEVDFRELLLQLTEAISGRSRMPISLEFEGETKLPPDIKIAFYHIAQEALNNVAKHARASYASVGLSAASRGIRMTVVDDGRGFIIDQVTPQHLGLTIMHERAEAIHAQLSIHSELDQGTQVTVEWNEPERNKPAAATH